MKKTVAIILTGALAVLMGGCQFTQAEIGTTATEPATSAPVAQSTAAPAETTNVPAETTTAPPDTAPAGGKTVQLVDLTSIADKPQTTEKLTDNYGNAYGSAINNSSTHFEYLTDGKYAWLKGTIYIPQGQSSDNNCTLTVKGDGHVLYASPVMVKTSRPVAIEVPVAGVNKLSLTWSGNNYHIGCCLAEAALTESGAADTPVDLRSLPIEITDLTSIQSKPEKTDRLIDTLDNAYAYAIYNTVREKDCFEYLLDKKYSRITGTLYIPKGKTSNNNVTMSITADGESIYQSPAMSATSQPVDFDVDVSKYNDVQITFSDNHYTQFVCIGNAYLYEI